MKNLIAIALVALALAACNSAPKEEEKIDFTKSYETAALALTDAQLAYDVALASNDQARIEAAKVQLETAKAGYLQSKTYYTANGGVVKSEYEQLLAKTNTSLGKAPDDTTTVTPTVVSTKPAVSLTKEPLAAAQKILDSGTTNANKKIKQVSDAITTGEQNVKQTVTKANESFTKASDTTKKRIEELKKQGDALRNLFKRNAATSTQN